MRLPEGVLRTGARVRGSAFDVPLLPYSSTPLLDHSITPILHYSITPILHYSITSLLHYFNTPFSTFSSAFLHWYFFAFAVSAFAKPIWVAISSIDNSSQ